LAHASQDLPRRRIAVFVEHLGSGGAEKVAVNVANALAASGFAVDMLMWRGKGVNLQDLSPHVGAIYFGEGGAKIGVFGAIGRLVDYHRKRRPEAVFSHLEKASLVALLAGLIAGRRVTIPCIHIDLIAYAKINHRLKRNVLNAAVMLLYPLARDIVAVSEGAAQSARRLLGLFNKPVRVIYNGFDIDRLKSVSKRAVPQAWLNDKTVPVMIACGRLTEQKAYDIMLPAFARLRARMPARLIILGEGPLLARLRALADELGVGEDVMIPGFVPDPISWFAKSDLYVMSSRCEALPTVLIEALVAGVPILSTDCPSGPREILDGGRFGDLVPVDDTEALSVAMARALEAGRVSNPHARARHLERFSLARMFEQYQAVIEASFPRPEAGLPRDEGARTVTRAGV